MKKLERRLTLSSVVAISIGGMLGSGIFVLPGIASVKTGPSIWLAYLLAGFCILPAALSKSELATAMPTSGGTYVFIERAFGPASGTIAGIGLWLSLLLKSSFALVGFGAYLMVLVNFPLKVASIGFLVIIMLLNLFGVKKVGKVQIFVVSLSLIGLLIILSMGLVEVDPANMDPFLTHGNSGLIAAAAFVYISYAGVTKVAAIAEEIKNPDRNLPLAMLLALFTITAVYALVSFTLVGHIPVAELEHDLHPIYTLAEHLGGYWVGVGAAVLGVITLISMANSGVLASSRFPFAMSRDELIPPLFKKIHPRFLTPTAAIIATCLMMALVILLLDVEKIAKLASAFKVMMFILVNACVIILRETAVQWYAPPYRAPLYPWMQIFGILSGFVFLIFLGGAALLGAVVIILTGLGVFYLYGRSRTQRSGVLRMYGHRPASFLLYRRQNNQENTEAAVPASNRFNSFHSESLDGALNENAPIVAPLFGKDRSPEMLIEMAGALSNGRKIQVIHLKEVPEQTALDALMEDDILVNSLNRRIHAMGSERELDIDFDAALTHDLVDTVHHISSNINCEWLVASWDGRAGQGIFVRNPIGWLLTHLNSNLALFKDNGVRYIRKILVALRPGRNNLDFIQTCINIAKFYGAELHLLRVVDPEVSEEEIDRLYRKTIELIDYNPDKKGVLVEKSKDPVQKVIQTSIGYDLLIIGTPGKTSWVKVLMGSAVDEFAQKAPCSVLRLTIR